MMVVMSVVVVVSAMLLDDYSRAAPAPAGGDDHLGK